MHFHLVTPCGRYGKCHGEPFLRRRSSEEPMDTPRRYYETEDQYQEGQQASAAAWEQWKRENFGDSDISRSPWFELVDRELQEINHLIQSPDDEEFDLGLQKLRDRVSASEQAGSNLEHVGTSASKEQRWRWLQQVRKAPPYLAIILKCLESDARRDEGKGKLFDLCDDAVASQTIRGPSISHHPQESVPPARAGGQAETRGETQIALAQLAHVVPPPPPSVESTPPSRISSSLSRLTPAAAGRRTSRVPSAESVYSTRTNSLPIASRAAPSRPVEPRTATHRQSGESFNQRPPGGVSVRDFAVEAANHQNARPQRLQMPSIAAPASASPQTALYITGGGTKPPTYISPSRFFPPKHGDEHGVERPLAYKTVAPSTPAAAHFMPQDELGEDADDIRMEGRRDQIGYRQTRDPNSIPEAQNGVGGGNGGTQQRRYAQR